MPEKPLTNPSSRLSAQLENFAQPLKIGYEEVLPGQKRVIDVPFGQLVSHDAANLRVHVFRGKKPGPRVLVCGGIHGNELNGIEIARQLITRKRLSGLIGDLVVIPIVNLPAFLTRSRYLPDRRDLNRLFPGAPKGSLGARLAYTFITDIALKCTHCIDLHTAADGRTNLPQARVHPTDELAMELAQAFHAPVVMPAPLRDGSIRSALSAHGIPTVLYEAGEANYIDVPSIRFGLSGIVGVLKHLGMLRGATSDRTPKHPSAMCTQSNWLRAPNGGLFRALVPLGKAVSAGDRVGAIGDPFSKQESFVLAEQEGIVIGRTTQALVDEGDALFHVGLTKKSHHGVEERITQEAEHLMADSDATLYSDPTPYYDPIDSE